MESNQEKTVLVRRIIEKDGFPKELKYYHTNDGVCRYSAFKQWLTDDNQKKILHIG